MNENIDKVEQREIINFTNFVPLNLITSELEGLYGGTVLSELNSILKYYEIYENGAKYISEGLTNDYIPANLKYKKIRALIDKEARFLFSKKPDVFVNTDKDVDGTILQTLVNKVLDANNLSLKLLQSVRDCLIGKRVACFLNFNNEGIGIRFVPSLEFIYETEDDDSDKLKKIIAFYTIKDDMQKSQQRIYKKKYYMKDGLCYVQESIYDGLGNLLETIIEDEQTLFTFIPAFVIRNGGLIGDLSGESEVELLKDYESWYSRLNCGDIDSLRQSMNSIKYTIDIDNSSSKNLSIAPGAYWDLSSDINNDKAKGEVGTIESKMLYTDTLEKTLKRIDKMMYNQVDIPDISEEQEKLLSGKALKAIYWPLIVRCDEKMKTWGPAIKAIATTIIQGAKLYPNSAKKYIEQTIPDAEYEIEVDNQYPFLEDEIEEKQVDISEVEAQVMSRKSYMKKWRGLTDEEANEELKQIALEREIIDNSYSSIIDNNLESPGDIL